MCCLDGWSWICDKRGWVKREWAKIAKDKGKIKARVISLKVFGDCFGIEMDSFKISGMVKNCSSSVSRSMVGFCCVSWKWKIKAS